MNPLLALNARKQIARLNRRELEFGYEPNSLRPLPRFYGTRGNISCRDEDLFELHAIINAIRGVRRAVNFVISAVQARNTELYAPSVALAYTSAFHAMGAYLSVEGRTFFDPAIWSSSEDEIVKSPVEVVVGIMTRDNKWKFEPRNRSHAARWLELTQLASRPNFEYPICFERLFHYMYKGQFQKGASMTEILADPGAHRKRMNENLSEFLEGIAQVRHLAIYRSAGEDPHAVEALWNKHPYAGNVVDRQAEAFSAFACEFLRYVADEIWNLFADIGFSDKASQDLGLCVSIPWYDQLKLDLLSECELKVALNRVESIVAGKGRGSV